MEGDNYYDLLSALQKSIRGSDPDAAVYYLGYVVAAVVATTAIIKRVRKIRNTKKSVENDEMNQDTKETNIDTQISKNTVKDSKKMYDAWRAKHTKTTEYDYALNDDEYYCKYSIDIPDLDKEKDQYIITRLAAIIINKLKEEITCFK